MRTYLFWIPKLQMQVFWVHPRTSLVFLSSINHYTQCRYFWTCLHKTGCSQEISQKIAVSKCFWNVLKDQSSENRTSEIRISQRPPVLVHHGRNARSGGSRRYRCGCSEYGTEGQIQIGLHWNQHTSGLVSIWRWEGKVRTFWETHKIWKNLLHGFDKSADLLSKPWRRFFQIMCASQKVRTLWSQFPSAIAWGEKWQL